MHCCRYTLAVVLFDFSIWNTLHFPFSPDKLECYIHTYLLSLATLLLIKNAFTDVSCLFALICVHIISPRLRKRNESGPDSCGYIVHIYAHSSIHQMCVAASRGESKQYYLMQHGRVMSASIIPVFLVSHKSKESSYVRRFTRFSSSRIDVGT